MFDNIENRRFVRLVAKQRAGKKWLCRCDCGNEKLVDPSNLKRGLTKSCGCLNRELCLLRSNKKHGLVGTPEYKIWQGMRQRCENSNDASYKDYGGRGIVVCDRWESVANFVADMGRRPSKSHSLDRIDTDGNYTPGNCRWATQTEQNRNKRNNIIVDDAGTRLADLIPQGTHSAEYQRARKIFRRSGGVVV